MEHFLRAELLQSWEDLDRALSALSWTSRAESFFQQLPIQKAWWESHGKPLLQSVAVYQGDKVVGLFPFFLSGETLHLNGHVNITDYMDVIVEQSLLHETWQIFGEYIHTLKGWRQVRLISIPSHSSTPLHLEALANRYGWRFTQVEQDVCPIISLPGSWEEYLQSIGKKQRHEVTRKWRRLNETAQVNFRVVTDTSKDTQALEDFYRLHRFSSPEKAAFWTAEHIRFFAELSEAASSNGWLRLYFIDVNNEPAAAMYCFDYQDSLLIYNSGFDAQKYLGMSVGNVLTAHTIRDAITLGKQKYDFLRGGEEYKFRYRAQPYPVFNLVAER